MQPAKKNTVAKKPVKAPTVANPLFPSTPKSFRVGGAIRVSLSGTIALYCYIH
jgi:hypothetical protein